jgi:hypothetical protein
MRNTTPIGRKALDPAELPSAMKVTPKAMKGANE